MRDRNHGDRPRGRRKDRMEALIARREVPPGDALADDGVTTLLTTVRALHLPREPRPGTSPSEALADLRRDER